jgi:hypothetical protein
MAKERRTILSDKCGLRTAAKNRKAKFITVRKHFVMYTTIILYYYSERISGSRQFVVAVAAACVKRLRRTTTAKFYRQSGFYRL